MRMYKSTAQDKIPKKIKEAIGSKRGMLTIVDYVGRNGNRYYIKVICDCGKEKIRLSNNILNKNPTSCGCTRVRNEIIGKKYGRWLVISDKIRIEDKYYVECVCECGKNGTVREDILISGDSTSCGCYLSDVTKKRHGDYRDSENYSPYKPTITYTTWASMRSRCYNIRGRGHKKYAGRGIQICAGWMGENGYYNFLQDMGSRPSIYYSIDRINGSLHYSCGHCDECIKNGWPFNCRWATVKEQNNNLSNNRYVTVNGIKMSCRAADQVLGFRINTVWTRIYYYGWPEEYAISIPPKKGNRNYKTLLNKLNESVFT